MSVLNVSAPVFEVTTDAYDPEYHWGGISIYPEGPIPTEVQYPGLPAGMILPPGLPIHLDFFVTPAPPHLAHIPLECPGAPRPDRRPVKPIPVEPTTYETLSNLKHNMGLYGSAPRLASSRPTFVYAYPCADQERWAHLPEFSRPNESNPRVQSHSLVALEEESYERDAELVQLQVSSHASDQPSSDARLHTALQNFRAEFRESA